MQKTVRKDVPTVGVAVAEPIPARCMETLGEIREDDWQGHMTLEVGGVKLIKDAP